MGVPHVSVRRHICWDPKNGGKPSEPTSTLVLTSATNFYVDVRILKAQSEDAVGFSLQEDSTTRIEWAFAGTSAEIEPARVEDGSVVMEWTHWVDSRHLKSDTGELPRDSGRLFPSDANGDSLETGRMANPDTGKETDYEELWGNIEPKATADGPQKISMVLQTTDSDDEQHGKGMVIRIGQFIQGLLVQNGELRLERWLHDGEQWRQKCRVGSSKLQLPCRHLSVEAPFAKGDAFSYEGLRWKVMEKHKWV